LDPPDVIRKKISRAKTDTGKEIIYDPEKKPEISNLMSIFSQCTGKSMKEIEADYEGAGYGTFKKDLAEAVVAVLEPIQARYAEIRSSGELRQILKEGAERASEVANATLRDVKQAMGFVLPY